MSFSLFYIMKGNSKALYLNNWEFHFENSFHFVNSPSSYLFKNNLKLIFRFRLFYFFFKGPFCVCVNIHIHTQYMYMFLVLNCTFCIWHLCIFGIFRFYSLLARCRKSRRTSFLPMNLIDKYRFSFKSNAENSPRIMHRT